METVFIVKDTTNSIISKGDQRVSSSRDAKNTFLIVNIKKLAFLSLFTVILNPSSYNFIGYPRFS